MSTSNVLSLGRSESPTPSSFYARKLATHLIPAALKAMGWVRRAVSGLCLMALAPGALCPAALAQSGGWVWQEGSDTGVQAGSYGTLEVASETNYPPARLKPVTWTDPSGKMWLFGGYDNNGNRYNDLWVFDPFTGYWTWEGGSKTPNQPGVYGTLGTAAAGNIPGARYGSAVWVDSSGKVWLFGGDAQYDADSGSDDLFSDLWTFDPSTALWTWVAGDSTLDKDANWGAIGSANSNNSPGSRSASGTWIDSSGTFWLFGGLNWWSIYGGSFDMNDLWSFNPKNMQWTWVSGTNTPDATPAMNVAQGVADPNNFPGAMDSPNTWIDKNSNFYLFGGYGIDQYGDQDALDDLWEYSPSTNQWTWVNGDESVDMPGIYGTRGVSVSGNHPGGHEYAASWIDYTGNFWLFGGSGYDINDSAGYLNDLWEYSPSASVWTWVAGSDTTAAQTDYGAKGLAASTNDPGSRELTGYWKDEESNFWLFGGMNRLSVAPYTQTTINDLWEYQFPAAATPIFSPAGGNYADNQSVILSDSTSGATIYYTTDGSTPTTNSTVYSSAISVTTAETIQAIAAAPGYSSSSVASATYTFTRPPAATPIISPVSGAYVGAQTVIITDATPNAVIYYTTNGSNPTTSSSVYTGALTVTPPATVKAIAGATDYTTSAVAIAIYTRPTVATPVISPASGTYTGAVSVTITDGTPGALLYYTTDGTVPTAASNVYTGPITVSLAGTVSAVAEASGYNDSSTATATYNIVQLTPTLTGISPQYISDGTAFTLTVNGTNFISGSTVYWGPNALTTQFVSATQLTAQVPAPLVSSGNAASQSYEQYAVAVHTPGAASVSNTASFLVVSPNYASLPITITPATATLTAGSSTSFAISTNTGNTLSVTPLNMPSGMTYLFTPGVTSSPGSGTSSYGTLVFTTTSATPKGTYVITILCAGTFPVSVASSSLLPILFLPVLLLRKKRRTRGTWLNLCMGMVLLASALAMLGCATQGNYKLQPTTASGYATNATTVTITVQ